MKEAEAAEKAQPASLATCRAIVNVVVEQGAIMAMVVLWHLMSLLH